MNNASNKKDLFMWIEKGIYNFENKKLFQPAIGPHGGYEASMIGGRKRFHTREELLKVTLWPKNKLNRISKLKKGSVYKMMRKSASTDLCIKCLTEEEESKVKELNSLSEDLSNINSKIKKTIPELIKERDNLEKKIAKSKRLLKKDGLY